MRVLVSQFRCPNCKMPIKNAFVEQCPKCNVRLTTNFVSQRLPFLAVIILFSVVFAGFYFFFDIGVRTNILSLVFSVIITLIIIGLILGYIYFKNRRKLNKDKEFVGLSTVVELEISPIYADIYFEKKFLYVSIFFLVCIGFLFFLLFYDLFVTDIISHDYFISIIYLSMFLTTGFAISFFYAIFKFRKKVNEVFEVK